jgi:hypothetical protein
MKHLFMASYFFMALIMSHEALAIARAAAKTTNLVSIACDVDNPDSAGEQRIRSFSVNRGVPNPNSDNCSDGVISYVREGYSIRNILSSGTGRLIYILVK